MTAGPEVCVQAYVKLSPSGSVEADASKINICPSSSSVLSVVAMACGDAFAGVIVTVSVAEAELPAASLAAAVQTLVVVVVTFGAVKTLAAKLPPFVQVTVGPVVMPTLSVAVRVDAPVLPPVTARLAGLNESDGALLSGVGVGVDPPPPPPQAERVNRPAAKAVRRKAVLSEGISLSFPSESIHLIKIPAKVKSG